MTQVNLSVRPPSWPVDKMRHLSTLTRAEAPSASNVCDTRYYKLSNFHYLARSRDGEAE